MPFQAPSWTEFYTCPICGNEFSTNKRLPISLGCGHTICRVCLATVYSRQCPFDQTLISTDVDNLPINNALLQLLNSGDGNDNGTGDGKINNSNSYTASATPTTKNTNTSGNNNNAKMFRSTGGDGSDTRTPGDQHLPPSVRNLKPEDLKCYKSAEKCIEELAQYLKSFVTNSGSTSLTRPMLRKLVTLVYCQLMEEEGRVRAVRTARFLGERTVTELLLQHQNPQQLSLCLWAAVRSRGCQFLGPSMQEEVLKLVLQALQNGSALSRKVLVMYVVQRLIDNMLPASKTSIGHVVQLLYRASCFKVSKREGDSSLMQLKEEFRNYEALRREHDAQIVQIATEAGLRIAPDQWSSLLYGNTSHKSHMQSICDCLSTPSSFAQSVQELVLALQRTGDPTNLSNLRPHLKHLATIDPSPESPAPTWQDVEKALEAVRHVVLGLVKFMQYHSNRKVQDYPVPPMNANGKYKISLCRDLSERKMCPRGTNCTFAHSAEERQKYRAKHRRTGPGEKPMGRSPLSAAPNHSGAGQLQQNHLEVMKKDYATNQNQQHNSHQNHALSTPNDNGNSPIKIKSPSRKYSINDNSGNVNIMRPGMMDSSGFMGDLSATTSPLNMQASLNVLHASPIPPGHLLGGPAPIINVPPMHKQPTNYDGIPYYGGKFVRMPNMGMPFPPNMRPPNIRGPISTSAAAMGNGNGMGGGPAPGQGIPSPRSTVNNPINMTTVMNPPNLQGTNSNKPSGSPLHKNMVYNNTTLPGDYYNTGPPSYFTNANSIDQPIHGDFPLRLQKNKVPQKPQKPLWDMPPPPQHHHQHTQQQQQQQQQCQAMMNPSEYSPNQHPLMYMPPPLPHHPHQLSPRPPPAADSNLFFDKNSMEYNTPKSNLNDSALHLPDSFIFKGNPQKDSNKPKTKMPLAMQEKSNMFWQGGNNGNHQQQQQHQQHNNTQYNMNTNSNNAVHSGVNIEPHSSSSLFRDRDSFVRSDSILDDDAATFDVPPTSSATLGSKFGPICPIYKGFTSMPPSTSSSTFVNSWNALIAQENNNQCMDPNNTNNVDNFTFSMEDDNNALNMQMEKHATSQSSSSSDHFIDPAMTANSVAGAAGGNTTSLKSINAFDNYDNMQAALSKLSFMDDAIGDQDQQQLNRFNFDLNPLFHINMCGKGFPTDMTKNPSINDNLLWNNSDVNNTKHANAMNLGSFWNEDPNVTGTPASISAEAALNNNNLTLAQAQQDLCKSQKHDDTELDITDIVDKIWPCGDDSGIKLD